MSENFKSIKSFVNACEFHELSAKGVCEWAINQNIEFIWHPLGFVMATLISQGDERIRLHLWSNSFSNEQKPTWLIHDHLFDLTSWVLSGSVQNIEYKKIKNLVTNQFYDVSYDSKGSVLSKTNTSLSLEESNNYITEKRGSYSVKSGVLHQSICTSHNTAVTLCHTINIREDNPLVIGDLDGDLEYKFTREAVSKNDLLQIIDEI